MGCLEFDAQRLNGTLAVFVFACSPRQVQKAHAIDTPNAPVNLGVLLLLRRLYAGVSFSSFCRSSGAGGS